MWKSVMLIVATTRLPCRWLWWLSPLWLRVALQVQRERVDRGGAHAEGPRVPQLLRAERSALCGGVGQHRTLRPRAGLLGGLTSDAAPHGQLLHHHVQWTPVCYRLSGRGGHYGHPELWRRHQPLVHGQLWTDPPVVIHTENYDPQQTYLLCEVRRRPLHIWTQSLRFHLAPGTNRLPSDVKTLIGSFFSKNNLNTNCNYFLNPHYII